MKQQPLYSFFNTFVALLQEGQWGWKKRILCIK